MKRTFNIFDGLFLMALYFKLTNTAPVPLWVEVFLPYIFEAVLALIWSYMGMFGGFDRIKFLFWNWALKQKVAKAGKDARKYMKKMEEAGSVKAAESLKTGK